MLKNPNGDSPVDVEIGQLFNTDRSQFDKTAKKWTKIHASKPIVVAIENDDV
jgi:ubiquitin-protein ligase